MQRATFARGNLLTFWQFSSCDVCPWSRPWMSLEVRLRDNCSAWAHTDCLNKSGGGYVLFVGVFVILFDCKKLFAYWKIWGAIMFKIGKFWWCYQTVFGVEYKLGRQSVLEIVYIVEIKYMGVDDKLDLDLNRRTTFRTGGQRLEKVPTLLKKVSAL